MEIVVARVRSFGQDVRFIACSATIPNGVDIAEWIGPRRKSGMAMINVGGEVVPTTNAQPLNRARLFEFGEGYRPCLLKRIVLGYKHPGDEWAFQTSLNSKLFDVVAEHSAGKPTLVFVATRKSTAQAATALKASYDKAQTSELGAPWAKPTTTAKFSDAKLQDLASVGLAYHHAGLSLDDRKQVEREFILGHIRVLCCTSTLAVGVNLPAHTVIIRGTKKWVDSWQETSELDLIQMMGRAGRPQYDREGVAVIMTDYDNVQRHQQMGSGQKLIESTLHHELVEHINSEVGLRAGCTIDDLQSWLRGTFLYARIAKNPSYYMAAAGDGRLSVEGTLEKLCSDALSQLDSHRLIDQNPDRGVVSTDFGDILSKYFISFTTMASLMALRHATMKDTLAAVCRAQEFEGLRFRQGEKAAYVKLRAHPEIRFPPPKVLGTPEKVSLLLQGMLAALPLPHLLKSEGSNTNPIGDILFIFRHAHRIVKAIIDVALINSDPLTAKNALELLRSINGKAWDSSPATMRQIDGIGEKTYKVLASAGLHSYHDVAKEDPGRIEMLLNKKSPFGHKIVASAASLPQLQMTIEEKNITRDDDDGSMKVGLKITVECPPSDRAPLKVKADGTPYFISVVAFSSDYERLFDFRRLPLKKLNGAKPLNVTCAVTKLSQRIIVVVACDEVAGSSKRLDHHPNIDPADFPAQDNDGVAQDTAHFESAAAQLAELEQMPGLFDDSDAGSVRRESVPAEAPVSKAVQQTPKDKPQNKTSPAKKGPAASVVTPAEEPIRLPNGNYKCRHPCKDTTKCRHLCCKEGLPAPPKKSKGGVRANAKGKLNDEAQALLSNLETITGTQASKPEGDNVEFNSEGTSESRAPAVKRGLKLPERSVSLSSKEKPPPAKKQKTLPERDDVDVFDYQDWGEVPVSMVEQAGQSAANQDRDYESSSPPSVANFIASLVERGREAEDALGDIDLGEYTSRARDCSSFRPLAVESRAQPIEVREDEVSQSQDELMSNDSFDIGFPIELIDGSEEVENRPPTTPVSSSDVPLASTAIAAGRAPSIQPSNSTYRPRPVSPLGGPIGLNEPARDQRLFLQTSSSSGQMNLHAVDISIRRPVEDHSRAVVAEEPSFATEPLQPSVEDDAPAILDDVVDWDNEEQLDAWLAAHTEIVD